MAHHHTSSHSRDQHTYKINPTLKSPHPRGAGRPHRAHHHRPRRRQDPLHAELDITSAPGNAADGTTLARITRAHWELKPRTTSATSPTTKMHPACGPAPPLARWRSSATSQSDSPASPASRTSPPRPTTTEPVPPTPYTYLVSPRENASTLHTQQTVTAAGEDSLRSGDDEIDGCRVNGLLPSDWTNHVGVGCPTAGEPIPHPRLPRPAPGPWHHSRNGSPRRTPSRQRTPRLRHNPSLFKLFQHPWEYR